MVATKREWTAEEALALPADGKRYEVLDGELVVSPAPSWTHQAVVDELHSSLRAYVRLHRLGWAWNLPADIVLSPERLVQPDLFVVPRTAGGAPRDWRDVRELLLAVEVLSPSTARIDRGRKRQFYQSHGVPEYWIVDADARLIERWRPTDARPEIAIELLTWQPRPEIEPLTIDLVALFAAAFDHDTLDQ